MSCFYILCTPWPVAWKPRLGPRALLPRICVSACTSACLWTPLAQPGFPALLFQPGVSKFWFPLGPSRNWKQRLSLEVCFVFVCLCECTCTHRCVCLCVCVCVSILYVFILLPYAYMHLFQGSFCVWFCKQIPCVCVLCGHVKAVRLHGKHSGWITLELWESHQSLLHMHSLRHGLRLSKCLAIYKK